MSMYVTSKPHVTGKPTVKPVKLFDKLQGAVWLDNNLTTIGSGSKSTTNSAVSNVGSGYNNISINNKNNKESNIATSTKNDTNNNITARDDIPTTEEELKDTHRRYKMDLNTEILRHEKRRLELKDQRDEDAKKICIRHGIRTGILVGDTNRSKDQIYYYPSESQFQMDGTNACMSISIVAAYSFLMRERNLEKVNWDCIVKTGVGYWRQWMADHRSSNEDYKKSHSQLYDDVKSIKKIKESLSRLDDSVFGNGLICTMEEYNENKEQLGASGDDSRVWVFLKEFVDNLYQRSGTYVVIFTIDDYTITIYVDSDLYKPDTESQPVWIFDSHGIGVNTNDNRVKKERDPYSLLIKMDPYGFSSLTSYLYNRYYPGSISEMLKRTEKKPRERASEINRYFFEYVILQKGKKKPNSIEHSTSGDSCPGSLGSSSKESSQHDE